MERILADISVRHDVIKAPGARLHRVSVEPGEAWARIAFLPGYGDHAMRYVRFLEWMGQRGVACHGIDFRGNGVSSGARGFVNAWEEYLDDLGALIESSFGSDRNFFVVAHSHGALVATAAALRGKLDCLGCVFLSPFYRKSVPPSAMMRAVAAVATHVAPAWPFKSGVGMEMLTRDPEMAEETRRDPLCLGIATARWYVTMMRAQQAIVKSAEKFTLPLLALIPEADTLVDPKAGEDFFRRAGSKDKTLKIYPEHRHELLRETDREGIYADICDWLRRRGIERQGKDGGRVHPPYHAD
jgi:alpha-beta hydrolase superfamily lysophospholipase